MTDILIYIAGAVLAAIGILAIAVLFCVFVYVRILGYPINLYFEKEVKNERKEN